MKVKAVIWERRGTTAVFLWLFTPAITALFMILPALGSEEGLGYFVRDVKCNLEAFILAGMWRPAVYHSLEEKCQYSVGFLCVNKISRSRLK